MLTKISFKKIQLRLRTIDKAEPKQYWVSFKVKASFCQTQKQLNPLQESNKSEHNLHFSASCSVYFENEDDVIEIKIYRANKEGGDLIISLAESVRVFMKTERINLQKHSEELEQLTHVVTTESLPDIKYLELKNILIDYMPLASKNQPMLLEVQCLNDRFRVAKPNKALHWPQSIRIYTIDRQKITFHFTDSKQQKIALTELKLSYLKHELGFRKNLITNEKGFPIGCIQFEYQCKGLASLRQSLKQIQTKQLYKIQITRIKAKLKEAHSNICLKILSDLNFFQTEANPQNLSQICFQTNNYIYASEPKCNFVIFGNSGEQSMVANGVINLHMLGKFDRKVVVKGLEGNEQIGSLIVSITCLKVQTKALRLKNISLNLDKYLNDQPNKQIFARATVGGSFGKTETHDLAGNIDFSNNLQVRYSSESQFQIQIVDPTNKTSVPVTFTLEQLQKTSKSHQSARFKSQSPLLEGTLSLDFQYFPKIEHSPRQQMLQIDSESAEEQLQCCFLPKPQGIKNTQKQILCRQNLISKKVIIPQEGTLPFQPQQQQPQQDLKAQDKEKINLGLIENNQHKKRGEHGCKHATKKSALKVDKKSESRPSPAKHGSEDRKNKQPTNKAYSRGSDRFQHILQIYLVSNATRRSHASKDSTSKNRSKSHSTRKTNQERCQLPQLPQIRNKAKMTYPSKTDINHNFPKTALEHRKQP